MRTSQVVAWLNTIELDPPVRFIQGDLPDKPDVVGRVAPGGGRLGQHEGAVDGRSFLVQIRGAANRPDQPEDLMEQLRKAIEGGDWAELGLLWCTQLGPALEVPGTLRTSRRPEAIATFSYQETVD